MVKRKDEEANTETTTRFTKEQLVNSVTYENRRDLLTVLLDDGEKYTRDEVTRTIDEFMKEGVS